MTNRQEVAEKLRQAGERLRGSCCSGAAVFVTVKDIIGISKVINRKAFFDRLADLIDPTCHMSWECGNGDDDTDEYMEEIAGTHEDTVACHCHECDEVFRYDRGIIPNYCPACGARVVRDDL